MASAVCFVFLELTLGFIDFLCYSEQLVRRAHAIHCMGIYYNSEGIKQRDVIVDELGDLRLIDFEKWDVNGHKCRGRKECEGLYWLKKDVLKGDECLDD